MWDLHFLTGDRTSFPYIGRQILSPWTTRETPSLFFYIFISFSVTQTSDLDASKEIWSEAFFGFSSIRVLRPVAQWVIFPTQVLTAWWAILWTLQWVALPPTQWLDLQCWWVGLLSGPSLAHPSLPGSPALWSLLDRSSQNPTPSWNHLLEGLHCQIICLFITI